MQANTVTKKSQDWVRGAHRYIAEGVRLFATYLGIFVLVTIAVTLTLPNLREQAVQIQQAVMAVLSPDTSASATADAANSTVTATASTTPVTPPTPSPAATAGAVTASAAQAASSAATRVALGALAEDIVAAGKGAVQRIPSITPGSVEALRRYIARKYKVAFSATGVLVDTAFQVGRQVKIDPLLLLSVIAIESGYNPLAESPVGAQGLMQVMTKVHNDQFAKFGSKSALDPIANIRVGARILRECIDRRHSVSAGLACYVGSTGPNDGGYASRVLAEQRRLAVASGIAVARN